jgi:hypothetical protein
MKNDTQLIPIIVPPGQGKTLHAFEKFFARCADEFARPEGPDMKRVVEISAEHGIYFVS